MKKYLVLALCAILAIACMFACGNETKDPEATKQPEATAQVTEAPEATEAPKATEEVKATEEAKATEGPADATAAPSEKPKKINVDGIVTDMSEEIPVDQFTKQNSANFSYIDGYAFASITNGGATENAYISFRLWDPRYIEEEDRIFGDEATDRTLADPAEFPFYAIKYRVTGEATTQRDYNVGSWQGNVISSPSDVIPYANHAMLCDNEWHTIVIDLANECPTLCSQCEGGADALDCVIVSAPADDESQVDIAWFGAFKSTEEINKWDENYTALYGDEVSLSK